MTKSIGVLLIVSSLLSLIAGALIEIKYGSEIQITGNVIENILSQTVTPMSLYDYVAGGAISYSIVSLMVGIVFLFRL